MLKRIWVMVILLCSMNARASNIAENIPHLRTFLANIGASMFYVTEVLRVTSSCGDADGSEFINGDAAPYTSIGTSERYFSSIAIPAAQNWGTDVCEIRFTINSTIQDSGSSYNLPVPSLVKGKKIVLTKLATHVASSPTWSCKTDIDTGLDNLFQGASSALIEGAPSITSRFADNLFLGNCLYTATPW